VFHRSEGGPNYLRASFFAEHRGHRHSLDELDPTDSKVALLRSHGKIGFVSRKSGRSLPLLLWRLPKSNAGSATVLVDELNPGFLKGSSYDIKGRATWLAPLLFELVNGHDADARSISQVLLAPT
jgi:hypothetical protein